MAGGPTSAIILRADLPAGLERLRRRSVAGAVAGVPAHLTLLFPFIEPDRLDLTVRRRIATAAADHATFDYRLVGPARWPGIIYIAVAPVEPFVALQADLAAEFPAYPIYGEPPGFAFVPHVTVVEGAAVDEPASIADPAWAGLPRPAHAAALEVIAADGSGWRLVWRLRLAGGARR